MKAYEIFQELPPETAKSIFQYLRDEQREVYTATLSSLAIDRKLRPVFVQRKPAPAQIEWLAKNVKLRSSEEIAGQVLQLWLMKGNTEMLNAFLDGVGIENDGEGAAEDLPEELDAKKLKSTVDKLLENYDPDAVRIYLHVFQTQRPGGWQQLTELIESRPELQIGEPAPPKEDESSDDGESEESAPKKKTAAKKAAPTKKAPARKKSSGDE